MALHSQVAGRQDVTRTQIYRCVCRFLSYNVGVDVLLTHRTHTHTQTNITRRDREKESEPLSIASSMEFCNPVVNGHICVYCCFCTPIERIFAIENAYR